jgi:hypothetical protein
VRELLDVESSSGNIGGHQQVHGAAAGTFHHPVSLILGHAAVQRLHRVAATGQRFGQCIDLISGAAEHQGERGRLDVEHPAEGGHLLCPWYQVGGLANLG